MLGLASQAQAQTTANKGFQVNRYEPTSAGEWSFAVDHPWYSSMRYFAGGITLNYAHNPLVFGLRDTNGNFTYQSSVIAHQLIGHIDLAGSFLDRVLISASLPVTFLERGTDGSNDIHLVGGTGTPAAAVGDPRLGVKVRLFGQPYKSAISLSLGLDVWIPINSFTNTFPTQVGESGVRVLPKVMLGGLASSVMWSFTAGFLYRPDASIGSLPEGSGNTVGPEIQMGAAIAYANTDLRLAVGPEALLSTVVTNGNGFKQDYTSLEVLLGIHYNIAKLINIGVGGGIGVLREPGTPDGRFLFRLAYAPMADEKPKDRDHDGIIDKKDACPDEPGEATDDPRTNGCPPPPPPDSDGDGVIDPQDKCPSEPKGQNPDPEKLGCPLRDRDGDAVFDNEDKCPDEPKGQNPDPEKLGCPLRDRDGDGVFDPQDQCVDVQAGPHPDPKRPGCPDKDTDLDGVYDAVDQCLTVQAGMFPDAARPGCPLPDRDRDSVPDPIDACPDKPGAPSPDPKKNGCPGLVEMKGGMIVILRQVFFATGKDTILKKSYPVLEAVSAALKATPAIKKVVIEGHTDNKGKPEMNRDLSERRARSVQTYLVQHGIATERLEAKGYGPDRPIADNKNEKGRALNRRTDFRITDPAPADAGNAAPAQVIDTPKIEPTGKEDKAQKAKAAPPPPPVEKPVKGKKGKKGKGAAAEQTEKAAETAAAAEKAADKAADKADKAEKAADKAEKAADKASDKAEKAEKAADKAADKADKAAPAGKKGKKGKGDAAAPAGGAATAAPADKAAAPAEQAAPGAKAEKPAKGAKPAKAKK